MRISYLAGIIVLAVALFFSWGRFNNLQAQAVEKKDPSSIEQRLDMLEHKLKNLEQITGFQLDDDKAIALELSHIRKEKAMAMRHIIGSMLQTIRSQMELYKVQHNDVYPDLTNSWEQLVSVTDGTGRKTPKGQYGPYMQEAPFNPITHKVKVVTKDKISPEAGWVFDPETASLKILLPQNVAESYNLTNQDVVTY